MYRPLINKAVVLSLFICAAAGSSRAQDAHLALITDVKGDVVVLKGGKGAPVQVRWGTQLFEGDEVTTKSGAGASVLFANNNLVTLGANSSLAIKAGPAPATQSVRSIDGPLLADVSGLTMHRTGRGDVAALGTLRSGAMEEGIEPITPRSSKVTTPLPQFEWRASLSMETFVVQVYDESGLIWKGETDERRLTYPAGAPTLLPDREYLWKVEGEELLQTVASPLVSFTVLSPEAREEVEAHKKAYEEQFGDDSNASSLHFMLGSFYAQQGMLSSAIASFERIAEQHPDAALSFEILGKLYTDVGLKDNAIIAYKRALALGE